MTTRHTIATYALVSCQLQRAFRECSDLNLVRPNCSKMSSKEDLCYHHNGQSKLLQNRQSEPMLPKFRPMALSRFQFSWHRMTYRKCSHSSISRHFRAAQTSTQTCIISMQSISLFWVNWKKGSETKVLQAGTRCHLLVQMVPSTKSQSSWTVDKRYLKRLWSRELSSYRLVTRQ